MRWITPGSLLLLFLFAFIGTPSAMAEQLPSGVPLERNLIRNENLLRSSNVPAEWHNLIPGKMQAYIYFPKSLKGKMANNILLIFGSANENFPIFQMYKDASEQLQMPMATLQSNINDHNEKFYYFYTLQLIAELQDAGLIKKQATAIIAGFSGGAKKALVVGTFGGNRFRGIVAVGCNEDYATVALQWMPGLKASNLPIILLNSVDDEMVKKQTPEVMKSLLSSGFKGARLMTYSGRHQFDTFSFVTAVRSFGW